MGQHLVRAVEGGSITRVSANDDARLIAGRFRLRERLGVGGMAQVYRASDRQLDRDVAVKLVDLRTDVGGSVRDEIAREARRAAGLRHPNVVQVHDVGTDDGHAYIVMEHIDGPTLSEVRDRDGPLPEHQVAELGVQICDALEAAHHAGVIHGDVKPGNVLLEDGRVKVTDFGVARAVDDTLSDETVTGTAAYLAPEQISDEEVDHRADLYALGVLLYELGTGRRPFHGATIQEVALQRLYVDPQAPSEFAPVSPTFDRIIARTLTRDPDGRFQTADELRAALHALTVDPTEDTMPLHLGAASGAGAGVASGSGVGALTSDSDAGASTSGAPGEASSWADRPRRRWLVGGLLAGLLIMAAGLTSVPDLVAGSSAQVPDLTGSTVPAAAELLEARGLEVGSIARTPSDRPAGTVIDQDPPPGEPAPADGTVNIVVAEAPSPSPTETEPAAGPDEGSPDPEQEPEGTQPEDEQQPEDQEQPKDQQQPEEEQEGDPGPADGRGPDGEGPPGQTGDPPGNG